ncbi:LacI family DNA-binding transcriptional regulator [Spirochaeta isovalerica]|uniref:LacI family transcriptional regulator n=1 Tax=Spirochaeta isovalerica TaxID=150 RepID=A0A841RED8_9SPIO|nr:LacI family DNA-binding transcriptional regulator [Spirochaeta isovalerica]MBB6480988.1 LacI family transcriptional regulator [Spirochaeta isovalerica]
MKVTIKDIAAVAGVSHSTVSRALNDSPQISPATKDKIKDIARTMNFEFNAGARSLSGRKTGNIAVVYQAKYDQFGSSLYVSQLFIELRHFLERMDMDVILLEGYHPDTGASNISRLLRQQKVDGFLIVHNLITKRDYESIRRSGLPVVQLHMPPIYCNKEELDYFFTDHFMGGRIATDYLIRQGCKKILTVPTTDFDSEEFKLRTQGYKQALEDNNIPFKEELVVAIDSTYLKGYYLFNSIPEILANVDGIFFQTDIQAFGFLTAARERGIRIPEDLKVIGYDDAPICESTNPQLTTVHQPRKKLAELACDRIIDLINKRNNESRIQEVLFPHIVVRETS